MLPTPSTSHVDYVRIYEPAEDSFLMMDTLTSQSETEFLRQRFKSDSCTPLVLEVGTGSGVVLAFVTANVEEILGRSDVATLGTDLNPYACAASNLTVSLASSDSQHSSSTSRVFLGTVNADLATSIATRSVDVLIFNPPYVPSESLPSLQNDYDLEDQVSRDSRLLALSTDGGVDGMESTNRLISDLGRIMTDQGVAYILLCAQNKPNEVINNIRMWPPSDLHGDARTWCAEKVSSSGNKAGWERLCIVRIWRETRAAE